MYLLINRHNNCVGIFSTIEKMKIVVETLILDEYKRIGHLGGDYHYRYIELNPDELWYCDEHPNVKAIFSLHTLHPEYFINKIEIDKTGKITKI